MAWNLKKSLLGGLTGAATGFLAGGPVGAAVGGGAGLVLGGMSSDNPYSQVGSPSDVRNVNPYTTEWLDRVRTDLGFYRNNLTKYLSGAEQYRDESDAIRRQLGQFKFGVEYDPLAAQRMFLSQTPELRQLAEQSLGTSSAEEQAKLLAAKATQTAASQFAGGGLRSGAALKAMAEGAATPLAQYQANREALLNNLLASLYGQTLQGLQQGEQYRAGLGLQQQQLQYGTLMDMLRAAQAQQAQEAALAQLMQGGALTALGAGAQYGAPNFWQPTYVPNANYASLPQFFGNSLLLGSILGTNVGGYPGKPQKSQAQPSS